MAVRVWACAAMEIVGTGKRAEMYVIFRTWDQAAAGGIAKPAVIGS